jgi:hypothetical protein
MGDHDAITLIKDMTYRGVKEEWSNTYTLDGTTPTSDAEWKTLADAIIVSEKTCYLVDVRVVRAMGYVSGSDNAAWSYDYLAAAATVAGTLSTGGAEVNKWAGDQAGWLRMRVGSTGAGKPKYIRKYFHGGWSVGATPDTMGAAVVTAYLAHGTKMTNGTLPGGMQWIGPNGTIGSTPAASPYVTTRTLKRRGRRPTPAP